MATVPLLAGPILRRAEPLQVHIWIATGAPVKAQAEIYQFSQPYDPAKPLALLGSSGDDPVAARTIRLGERLYVTLIRAQPRQAAFPQDQLLAYDLVLDGQRLADLGLLSGSQSIRYEGLPLPTFFLASQTTSLLHGSCRNLGGSGRDALPGGDDLIAHHAQDLELRPSLLILDGDQIYADHLPSPLIRSLTGLGNELMGWEESIPGVSQRLADIPVDRRADLARDQARFTTGGGQNQLLAFGEFAALYLLAWNEANWPERLPPFPSAEPATGATPVDQVRKAAQQVVGLVKETPEQAYQKQVDNLMAVKQQIPAVRRLLANIPTYMMFDDHDTTDDLFLTKKWKEDVWASPTGRRVVANALAAAWAFQCWGNDPDLYPESFLEAIATHLEQQAAGETAARRYEETLWDFADWTFHLPGQPVAIVLDTRTQRGYDSDEGAARLLGEEGLRTLARAAARAGYQRGQPLILVSPTPVVGYETVEGMQELVSRYVGPYRFDLESWHANLDGYTSFFEFLISELEPQTVVILAGDVHYGFTISASFTWRDKTLPIVQLTSSALKNTGLALQIVGLVSLFAGRTDRHLGWDARAGDGEKAKQVPVSGKGAAPAAPAVQQPVPLSRGRVMYVVKGQPIIIPASLAADAGLEAAAPVQGQGAPDWQDARTFEPAWGYRSEPIVGDNNLGLVRFRRGNLLIHRLLVATEEGTRASTAIVRTLPGQVVLTPVES